MNKKLIRLTESDLHKIVKESVQKILNEIGDTPKGQDALGQVSGRAQARASAVSGAASKRFSKTAKDARDKAYSEADKIGMYRGPFSKFDDGTTKGYKKGIKYFQESIDNALQEGIEDCQMRFDSILNTCEEETERLIASIYKSDGIFSAGNDEAMEMRLRRLLKLLKTHAPQTFERVKNSMDVDRLLDILSNYYSIARQAHYNIENLDYQGVNSYVNHLEHLLVGVL